MKKVLFSIFAHPDDEGFGPSGTLIKEARDGTDVHLLCITRGDAGRNVDSCEDLGAMRIGEWQAAGRLIGATSMQHFGYSDGGICNGLYHEIADKLEAHIESTLETYDEDFELHFMTFDCTGLSGHLDHIAVSMITTFSFLRLQQAHPEWRFGQLRYFCLPHDDNLAHNISYIYMPPGRPTTEIDENIDISDVYEQKLKVMCAHHSQRDDMNWILQVRGEGVKSEQFRYLK